MNVTWDLNGTLLYSNESTGLNINGTNINFTLDTTGFDEGNISIFLQATDDHTKTKIDDYETWKHPTEKYIEYYTAEGNFIKVETPEIKNDIKNFNTYKDVDRYVFNYELVIIIKKIGSLGFTVSAK